MKVAIIGQSQFGAEVYKLLRNQQHKVVGVFTIPDVNGKPDVLGKCCQLYWYSRPKFLGKLWMLKYYNHVF